MVLKTESKVSENNKYGDGEIGCNAVPFNRGSVVNSDGL